MDRLPRPSDVGVGSRSPAKPVSTHGSSERGGLVGRWNPVPLPLCGSRRAEIRCRETPTVIHPARRIPRLSAILFEATAGYRLLGTDPLESWRTDECREASSECAVGGYGSGTFRDPGRLEKSRPSGRGAANDGAASRPPWAPSVDLLPQPRRRPRTTCCYLLGVAALSDTA